MEKLSFEDIYNKYLKNIKNEDEFEFVKYKKKKMTQEQQINFLKSLGKQNYGYDDYKIESCSQIFDKNSYGAYIVRIPIVEEPILDKDFNIIEQPVNYHYKTSIIGISDDTNEKIIDNICKFESDNLDLVSTKYNELVDIIKSSNEDEILTFIDSNIGKK